MIQLTGTTIDGLGGNDTFNITIAGNPAAIPNHPFTLIIDGGTGSDRVSLNGLPSIPNLNLVLDGDTTTSPASAAANPGDVLSVSGVPSDANVSAFNDYSLSGALQLEFHEGLAVSGFAERDFGTTPVIDVPDGVVNLVGDYGAGTVFGVGVPSQDQVSVRETGFRQFTAQLNGAAPIRFAAPRLELLGKKLADTFDLAPLAGGAGGVNIDVEGSDVGDHSASGPGTGDLLRLTDTDPLSNDIGLDHGGTLNNPSGVRFGGIDSIIVVSPQSSSGAPNTLTFTDSTPGNTMDVNLGASGVVSGAVFDPIMVLKGPNVDAPNGLAVSSESGNQPLQLVLRGGGHTVNVVLTNTSGSVGRTLAVTGEASDRLHLILSGRPTVKTTTKTVFFRSPKPVRRQFVFVRVRYPGRTGATYTINFTKNLSNQVNRVASSLDSATPIRPISTRSHPEGPLFTKAPRKQPQFPRSSTRNNGT
jgi:hypothetical protein